MATLRRLQARKGFGMYEILHFCTNLKKFKALEPTKNSHLKCYFVSLSFTLPPSLCTSPSTLFTFQAARVSHQCDKLKETGFYLRTRPYQYSKTSLLELDSYLAFTQAAKLRVGNCISLLLLCLCWLTILLLNYTYF